MKRKTLQTLANACFVTAAVLFIIAGFILIAGAGA